ncbi:MAG: formate/nitrite transporter family protein [Candidatus Phytoplasma sp.]|nr:formate/nitrite transporter family protein [Phytoplasma sp.]
MKYYINVLSKAVLAGIVIAIAGTIYLTVDNKVIGSFLFGFGLLVVVSNKLNLFTGKVGYVIDKKPSYLIDIFIIIIGNLLGVLLIALMVNLGGLTHVRASAISSVDLKLSKNLLESFALSIGCGMMMYLGVDGYYKNKNDFGKVVVVLLAVMIFILAKFEHSIANMFYFTAAGQWSFKSIIYLIVMLLGNGVGAVIINGLEKIATKTEGK